MTIPRFTMEQADSAHDVWCCNCGPAALACIAGLTLDEVRPLIPGFEQKRFTNPTMMRQGLEASRRQHRFVGNLWPEFGLVRVQWEGPWTAPGVPMAARYRHTHWIGTILRADRQRGIWDVNCLANGGGWVSLSDWESVLVPWLLQECHPKANGRWHITHAYDVERPT